MDKFNKKSINKENFFLGDDGIEISVLLTLIENSDYYKDVLEYFKIETNNNSKINIKGAKTIFTVLKKLDETFCKQDLVSNLSDINFDYEKGFAVQFNNLTTNPYLANLEINSLKATPIHSGERDFFSNLYEIDKYASKLIRSKFTDILDQNLELLKTKGEHSKKYRLIHDCEDNTFYLRAIVSEDRYQNYDNGLTVVIALLKLHFEMTATNVIYDLHSFEYNESFIRMFFKTSETVELKGVGFLENAIQVSNDEIKREALKFSNVCSIIFADAKKVEQCLLIKPKDIKSKVLSITHGTGPKKAFKNLEDFTQAKENFTSLLKEIETITTLKDHNQIVHLVKSKIENSNTVEIKKHKEELKKVLLIEIKTTTQLMETFNKLIFLEGLEIDAKEYLRYLIYEALINRK
jgi:hypothetical protein